MKYQILFLLCFGIACSPKLNLAPELKPPFSNQGEQEDYWAQEFFKKEYQKKEYPRFTGRILQSSNRFQFGGQTIEFVDINSPLRLILEQGLIYPSLIGGTNVKIGNLEELTFLSNDPKIKRFRFWHYERSILTTIMANPQVYLFELQNKDSNSDTTWTEFVANANLTFLKAGWIIL